MGRRARQRVMAAGLTACLCAGCAHHRPPGGSWGDTATISPDWAVLGEAAMRAATDPATWAPVVGAAVLQLGDADAEVAADLRRETPLFGSADTAADASDGLRLASVGVFVGLGLAAPAPEDPPRRRRAKARGLLAGGATLGAATALSSGLKVLTQRTRPNGENDRSLPSGHAATTAAAARLAVDTLDYYALRPAPRRAARAGLALVTGATAWARVEAGEHFPSDVLLGAALGNFLARFATRAFLDPGRGGQVAVESRLLPGGGVLTFYTVF